MMKTKPKLKKVKMLRCKGCGEKPDHIRNIDLNVAEGSLEDSYGSWECDRCHNINTLDARETQYLFNELQQQKRPQ